MQKRNGDKCELVYYCNYAVPKAILAAIIILKKIMTKFVKKNQEKIYAKKLKNHRRLPLADKRLIQKNVLLIFKKM